MINPNDLYPNTCKKSAYCDFYCTNGDFLFRLPVGEKEIFYFGCLRNSESN